ncbi:hypothetical protein OU995_21240 [Roseateles sp. SL47]|uniref:hypothetical protein n=1 Tax=Roseateles sp. SL47 TaxID=2995138 RepID=UPI00226D63AD|nr:hypothetical protein [Roseateles sp. SL47]WAC72071.1 hypothetical protein OU995_21240 [Roseateles sp. SL47]
MQLIDDRVERALAELAEPGRRELLLALSDDALAATAHEYLTGSDLYVYCAKDALREKGLLLGDELTAEGVLAVRQALRWD